MQDPIPSQAEDMWLCCGGSSIAVTHSEATSGPDKKLIALYGILFVVCLLVVLRVLPYGVAFAAVLICIFLADHPTLGRVDYAVFSNYLETAKDIGATMPSLMFIAEHWQDVAKPFVETQLPGYDTYVMGGHLMFYEYPEKWNSVLEGFLNKL